MKGDRDPETKVEYLPSEAEGKRRVKRFKEIKESEGYTILLSKPHGVVVEKEGKKNTCGYYLIDPETYQRRYNKELLHQTLRKDLRPDASL
jgi:hypothetical protein